MMEKHDGEVMGRPIGMSVASVMPVDVLEVGFPTRRKHKRVIDDTG